MGLPPQFTAIARCRLEASTFFTPEHSTSRLGEHPKPLERSLERIGVLQSVKKKRFLSKNWLKTKIRLAKQHEHIKDFRRDSLNSVFYSHRSTTFWC
jgi:transposase